MEQWRINAMLKLVESSKKMHSKEDYLMGRVSPKRKALASLYKQMVNIGAGFPDKPAYSTDIPRILCKKVDNGCPACVKTRVMAQNIDSAMSFIKSYARTLEAIINELGGQEKEVNIHDLTPTDDA